MLARIGQALNCPGDPGCPGNPAPLDVFNLPFVGPTSTNPLVSTELALSAAAMNPNLPAPASGFSQALASVGSGTVLAIGGGVIVLLLLTRGRRR